jgi:4-diphosphocytidyl-2C-methyl-D-erythritol kinase
MVVVPGFAVSTADVYQAYDELDGSTSPRVVPAPSGIAAVLPPLLNDLEVAAEHVEPRLREFRRELEAASGLPPLLAGSGSAYIMLCGDETEWRKLAARVEQTLGLPVHSALSLQPYPVWRACELSRAEPRWMGGRTRTGRPEGRPASSL